MRKKDILEIKKQIIELRNSKGENSVNPVIVGDALLESLNYLDDAERLFETEGIVKVYETLEQMNSDILNITTIFGRPIREGQFVIISNENSEYLHNGKKYSYSKSGWKFVRKVADFMNYYTKKESDNLLFTKVDKISGKGLSTNDFDNGYKEKLDNYDSKVDITTKINGYSLNNDVNLFKNDVGLDNVDNTTDKDKPISTAQQTALDLKVDKIDGKGLSDTNFTSNEKNKLSGIESGSQVNTVNSVSGRLGDVILTKNDVGLNNVDNTSDTNKPVSTAQQTALDLKVDKINGKGLSTNDYSTAEKDKLSGIESGSQVNTVNTVAGKEGNVLLDKTDVGLDNVDNTSDVNKPVSTAQQTALDTKVDKINGKGLSTNDYTPREKLKLHNIEEGAQVNVVNSVQGRTGDVVVTKNDLNIENVTNDAQVKRTEMGVASGVATLDSSGKVPLSQIPDSLFGKMNWVDFYNVVTNTPDIENSNPSKGDYYIVRGTGIFQELEVNTSDWLVFNGTNWDILDNTDQVTTVAGKRGDVTLTKNDVGLNNVDNTSDIDKPISTAQQTALDTKVDKVTGKQLSTNDFNNSYKEKLDNYDKKVDITRKVNGYSLETDVTLTKNDVDLNNVDNTSDTNKPISTAQQTALDLKVDKINGKGLSTNDYSTAEKDKLSGIESGAQVNVVTSVAGKEGSVTLTKNDVGLNNVDNTSDVDKPVSTQQQTALNLKVDKVTGKQLSTNDFSNILKDKLSGIESGAQVNVVTSVAGRVGTVILTKEDVGLNNVDNTSDVNKPISTAQQTVLDTKADKANTYDKNYTDLEISKKQNKLTSGEGITILDNIVSVKNPVHIGPDAPIDNDIQIWIDEDEDPLEQEALDGISITGEKGQSTTSVMHQKAVTDALEELKNFFA